MTEVTASPGLVTTRVEVPAASSRIGHAETPFDDVGIAPGDVVAERYRIERPLAEGGMGVVYLARHVELGQEVAVKLLRPEYCGERRVVARFVEEAKAAATLRSEHVVRVMDVGLLPSGVPYLVMEYLEGTNLGDLVERRGALAVDRAVEYALQACDALAAAHGAGIVHRDIKPDNLFLTTGTGPSPVVKLVDFGIAKRLDAGGERVVTGPQEFMGSPGFMSPEQIAEPAIVDARTDLFSLGGVLYYLLSGQLPFDGESLAEICDLVLYASPRSLSELRPAIDADLEGIVRRCLQKDRSNRYGSARQLAADLERWAERRAAARAAVAALPSRPAPIVPGAAPPLPVVRYGKQDLPMSGSSLGPVISALAGVAVAAGLSWGAHHQGWIDVRSVTDGWLTRAPLGPDPELGVDTTGDRRVFVIGPRGVVSSGRPYGILRAEPERVSLSDAERAERAWQAEAARRRRAYRAYLQRNGLRPLREVLREVSEEMTRAAAQQSEPAARGQ